MYKPELTTIEPVLADELKPGDRFRLTRRPFSVVYSYDYHTKTNICGHGIKPNGEIAYATPQHYDTVYKIKEV